MSYYSRLAKQFMDESEAAEFLAGDLPTQENVRGTLDLPLDSEDELEEFVTALDENEYSRKELRHIDRLLKKRNAPHDKIRRMKLRDTGRVDLELSSDSGTDTDGSDVESERSFSRSHSRKKATSERQKLAKKMLGKELYRKRLKKLASGAEDGKVNDIILNAPKRPRERAVYYRKDTKFYEPSLNVSERAELHGQHTLQESIDIELLNNLLASGMSIEEASGFLTSKFMVGQYRGMFYNPKAFDQTSRAQHRTLDETHQPILSSSALQSGPLGLQGYYYLSSKSGYSRDFEHYKRRRLLEARKIRAALLEQRDKAPSEKVQSAMESEKIRVTERFKPVSLADQSTHLYSEKYDFYHEQKAKANSSQSTPFDDLFKGQPFAGNPKVSVGDVPTHAARYAYGLKPYAGHEEDVLEPGYNQDGRPRHPYSGKIYISVHPLTDYAENTGPSQLVDLQNKGRINLSQVIIPERETQFEGFVEQDRLKATIMAKFPSFDREYLKVYAEKYGLSERLFDTFKKVFSTTTPGTREFTFIEASLSKLLAMHSELLAIEKAQAAAKEENATLVYRTGANSFGFTPQAIIRGDRQVDSSIVPPMSLDEQVTANYGTIININGEGMACYIRSLVTAGIRQGFISDNVEDAVNLIAEHLANQGMRVEGEMIDAGSITAAEVRRVLHDAYQGFDPAIRIVMWNSSNGQLVDYFANAGTTQQVWMYYTPGHFNLIDK